MYDELFTGRSVQLREDEDQGELILAAKAGDTDAKWRLLQTYAPLMRRLVQDTTRANPTRDELADRRGTAVEALLEAIRDCDPDRLDSFGGFAWLIVRRNLMAAEQHSMTVTVPEYQRRRYLAFLKAADGDVERAAEAAAAAGKFRRSSFLAIHTAFTTTSLDRAAPSTLPDGEGADDRTDEAAPLWEQRDPVDVAEARMLAEQAVDSLDDERALLRQIVVLAYGLGGEEPVSDIEIAKRVGMHRDSIHRLRTKALVAMRESLGLNADGSEATL